MAVVAALGNVVAAYCDSVVSYILEKRKTTENEKKIVELKSLGGK